MAKIIRVAGYKAFTGTMRIMWQGKPAEEIYGDWVYVPAFNKWFGKNGSFPADICVIETVA